MTNPLMKVLEENKGVPFYLFKVKDSSRETDDSAGALTKYYLQLESNLEKTDLEIDAQMKLGSTYELDTVANMLAEKYPNIEVEVSQW